MSSVCVNSVHAYSSASAYPIQSVNLNDDDVDPNNFDYWYSQGFYTQLDDWEDDEQLLETFDSSKGAKVSAFTVQLSERQ